MQSYTIKEVSQMFQLPASTLRYYEDMGILTDIARTESGQRLLPGYSSGNRAGDSTSPLGFLSRSDLLKWLRTALESHFWAFSHLIHS